MTETLAAQVPNRTDHTIPDYIGKYQVMRKLVAGRALKEIAHEMDLSVKTVSTHRRRLLDKLCLHTTADLVRYAIRHDLTE